ncbi:MAG: long-chain fatty acid--CoA ligase [Leptospiraceae bacterium]|nr:long-chain fatty acid--CoA ligase [Leptospiraceae bacterium]MCP5513437.1 long-chain fatty acid--CoA ligase [Leptospiraceae bacterium]
MPKFRTLNEMFLLRNVEFGDQLTFFSKDAKKQYQGVSLRDVYTQSEYAGLGLMGMGLEPGDRVGLMSDNRVEWAIADISVLLNGAVNVPRGSDSTAQEIQYILEHSESKFCFIEHEKLLNAVLPIIDKTAVTKIIVLDKQFKKSDNPKVMTLAELIESGKKLKNEKHSELVKRAKNTTEDDLFTIIYTSGTTGLPKGVMLTHKNMVYNINHVPRMVDMRKGDRMLSILPVWHIFERAIDYAIVAEGAAIYYTNIRDLRDDFGKAKPTFMASAPRLWENLYLGIKQKVEKSEPLRQVVFNTAFDINKNFQSSMDYIQGNQLQTQKEEDLEKLPKLATAAFTAANLFVPSRVMDAAVFSKIREALGGELRGTISGGGALPTHVDEFFNVIGIPVYEGYGMTECAPIISVRTVGKVIQGSVGVCPPGTEVRILNEKGEEVPTGEMGVIHVKGPQVMKGYYKNPEATEKTLKNGWLNTGDLGFKSFNGTLSVRGRVKDTVVLLGGENVEPVPIENLLLENPFINQVMVVGQDQKSLGALIHPSLEKLAEAGFTFNSTEDLNKNSKIVQHFVVIIKDTISTANGFKSFEKVTDFRFIPKPFEVGDELTNLYKMKRNVITDKYTSLIKEMYS